MAPPIRTVRSRSRARNRSPSLAAAAPGSPPGRRPARAAARPPAPAAAAPAARRARAAARVDGGVDRPMIVIDAGPDGGGCTPAVTCTPAERALLRRHRQRLLRHHRLRRVPERPGVRIGVCVGGPSCVAARLPAGDGKVLRQRRRRLRPGDGLRRLRGQARPAAPPACAWRPDCVPLTCNVGDVALLRRDRRRLRRHARLRRLSGARDLRGPGRRRRLRRSQLQADQLHAGGRRPLLRRHRRRLRRHARLRHRLSGRHGLRRRAARRRRAPERLPRDRQLGPVHRHRLHGADLHGHRRRRP